jgi:hypothetical protein
VSSNTVVKTTFLGKDSLTPVVKGINNTMDNFRKSAREGFGIAAGIKSFDFAYMAFDRIKDFAVESVQNAARLEQAYSKVSATFGEAGAEIVKFSQTSARSLGISQRAALESAGTMGNLMRAVGFASDASAEMSLNLVKLAADVAAYNNVPIDRVFTAFSAALVGEAEPARRLGAFVSMAEVNEKILASGIVKTVSEITDAMKVQARYQILLEDMAHQMGQVGREFGNFSQQVAFANGMVEDISAAFGGMVLLVISPMLEGLNHIASAISTITKLPPLEEGHPVKTLIDFYQMLQRETAGIGVLGLILVQASRLVGGFSAETSTAASQIDTSTGSMADGFADVGDSAQDALSRAQGWTAFKPAIDFTGFKPTSIVDNLKSQLEQFKKDITFLAENPNYWQKIGRQYLRLINSPAFKRVEKRGGFVGDSLIQNILGFGAQQLSSSSGSPTIIRYGKHLGKLLGQKGKGPFLAEILNQENMEYAGLPVLYFRGHVTVRPEDVVIQAMTPQDVGVATGEGASTSTTNEDGGSAGGGVLGGAMNPYKRYLVGERGPEWLIMGSQGGRLLPNGGNGDIVVNVDGERLFRIMNKRMGRALSMGV